MNPAPSRGWTSALVAFTATFVFALLVYGSTIASLVNIWRISDTFAHGFLVLPVCVLLAWRSRDRLVTLQPRPYPLALIGLLPLGFGWIMGRAASTLSVEQFCFVAMIPILVIAHFGPAVARRLAFPLAFLFFAVPFGDVFQPRLMEITAGFAERTLRWSGVEVSREGLFLATTNSRWRVVESCSGLRFTVAGVVLATLFAHLSYRSNLKRAIFVASAVPVSILANGIRAYVLIMLGHLTHMRRGVGFDHYMYGWLVFTLVMAAFFMIGSAFRDPERPATPAGTGEGDGPPSAPLPLGRRVSVAALAAIFLAAWPVLDAIGSSRGLDRTPVVLAAPAPQRGWVLEAVQDSLWKPHFLGATSELNERYAGAGGTVQCFVAYYTNQSQGRELLHTGNRIIVMGDPTWLVVGEGSRSLPGSSPPASIRETSVRGPDGPMVVWSWYWLPDEYTSDPFRAKWLQAKSRMLGRGDRAAVIVLAATAPDPRDAERLLAQFSGDMLPSIRLALRSAQHSR